MSKTLMLHACTGRACVKADCENWTQKVLIYLTGVDHSQLVDLAKAAFSFLPKGEPAAKEASKYHGGNRLLVNCFFSYEVKKSQRNAFH